MTHKRPSTMEVLNDLASLDGIVVGSAVTAIDPTQCKDIDVVIGKTVNHFGEEIRHPGLQSLMRKYSREYVGSTIVGHLVIDCAPVPVEIFVEKIGVLCKNKEKVARIRAYSTLKRFSEWKEIVGVPIRVYQR